MIKPIPVRWVKKRADRHPDTNLYVDIVPGELLAELIPSTESKIEFCQSRSLSCRQEATRYRKSAVRVWSGEIPTPEEVAKLPPSVQLRYRESLALHEVVEVWEEQARAWDQLGLALLNEKPAPRREDK